MNLQEEFDRQVTNLIEKGYPQVANLTTEEFEKQLEPLKSKLKNLDLPEIDLEEGYLPFVIVIENQLIFTDKAMELIDKDGREGVVKLSPLETKDFEYIESVQIPESPAYLLLDIDRGKDNRNLPPQDAMELIVKASRSPLTIEEGIAIVTQFPEFLIKNNCFSLLASRHAGDKRVPAIWINAHKNPNLGWCWNGNPHTWLGSASCKNRMGFKIN